MADNPQTEEQRIRAIQQASAEMASKRGGLVLGADQAHAIGISAALNKLKGIDNLTDKNFISWRQQIIGQLDSIQFNSYLGDHDYENINVGPEINNINRTNLTEFLFSRMDESNSARFRSALTDLEVPLIRQVIRPTAEELAINPNARSRTTGRVVPEFVKGPSHIWKIVKEYHQSNNKASLFLIQSKLNNFQQDYKTSITTHIDAFTELKNEFVNRGGHIDEAHLGRLLLHSLDISHQAEVKYILNHLTPITSRGVIKSLKSYEDNNLNFKLSAKPKSTDIVNNLKLAGNTFKPNTLKPKCTPTKCLGPHPAKECFKKPENRQAEKEWFESKGLKPPNRANLAKAKDPEPPTSEPAGVAAHTSTPTTTRQLHYVFMAYGNEVNLVHPKFEAIWDTGASSHMFNDYIFFKNIKNNSQTHSPIMTAGTEELSVEVKGDVMLKGVTIETITLQDSLYIPSLRNNLIAAGALKQKGATEIQNPSDPGKFIIAFNGETFLRGRYVNNLMVVTIEPVSNSFNTIQLETPQADQSNLSTDHNQLGHLNPTYLKKTVGEKDDPDQICDTC
ncbi:hypothetical protein MJO29_000306 [Puccinia striiformis f. sp. tritici]|nr:hypothetical protein MJO29_000306 [Puccinia striiformis f. sp. tritici]